MTHSMPDEASLLAATLRIPSNTVSGVTYFQRAGFEFPNVVSVVTYVFMREVKIHRVKVTYISKYKGNVAVTVKECNYSPVFLYLARFMKAVHCHKIMMCDEWLTSLELSW